MFDGSRLSGLTGEASRICGPESSVVELGTAESAEILFVRGMGDVIQSV